MKYVFLVSHGKFAEGLHNALSMLAGDKREDLISEGLLNGMGADEFAEKVREKLSVIGEEDEIILLGDLFGGSPLTTASNVLAEEGMLGRATIYGGVNLPMALSAILMKDAMDTKEAMEMVVAEAKEVMMQFSVAVDEAEDDI